LRSEEGTRRTKRINDDRRKRAQYDYGTEYYYGEDDNSKVRAAGADGGHAGDYDPSSYGNQFAGQGCLGGPGTVSLPLTVTVRAPDGLAGEAHTHILRGLTNVSRSFGCASLPEGRTWYLHTARLRCVGDTTSCAHTL